MSCRLRFSCTTGRTARSPAATGGNGAIAYTASNLPAGLKFDATGTDAGGCTAADFPPGTATWATAPRTVCGMPAAGAISGTINIHAHDADSNRADSDRASLSVVVTLYSAFIQVTTPSPLAEGSLNGATVRLQLDGASFVSGVTASSFELVTAIPNVSISNVSGAARASAWPPSRWPSPATSTPPRTLAVRVLDAAHDQSGDLTTDAVSVFPTGTADTTPTFGGRRWRTSPSAGARPSADHLKTTTLAAYTEPTPCQTQRQQSARRLDRTMSKTLAGTCLTFGLTLVTKLARAGFGCLRLVVRTRPIGAVPTPMPSVTIVAATIRHCRPPQIEDVSKRAWTVAE